MSERFHLLFFGHRHWRSVIRVDRASRSGQMLKALLGVDAVAGATYVNPYFFTWSAASLAREALANLPARPVGNPLWGLHAAGGRQALRFFSPVHVRARRGITPAFRSRLVRRLSGILPPGTRRIAWFYNAAEIDTIRCFPGSVPVFDTTDNWLEIGRQPAKLSQHPWYDEARMRQGYERVAREDVLIVSNGEQMTSFFTGRGAPRSRILQVNNGVDAELFDPDRECNRPVPADMAAIPRPVAGYVGLFENRVDVPLLRHLTGENPDISFVMIGPLRDIEPFSAPNLHWLGRRDYRDVPRYIGSFDVCLLPHRRVPLTRYMSPMKVYEYLAMGKPVVATAGHGVEDVSAYCLLAADPPSFSRRVREAAGLANSETSAAANRAASLEVRTRHTWAARANAIVEWIQSKS